MIETTNFGSNVNAPAVQDSDAVYDVIIAGAGFAGLALAAALARGLGPATRIALIAREAAGATKPQADSRASALSAASVRMLDRLGVWAYCEPEAQPVTGIDLTDSELAAGVRPTLLSYQNVLASGEVASHIILNSVLEAALATRVRDAAQVSWFAGEAIGAFEAGVDDVTVTLASGAILKGRLLVAADGRRSALREKAGVATVGWAYPQTGITVTVRHERPHCGRAVQHFLPSGPFAMLPLPGLRSCITWSEETDRAKELLALDDAAFIAELETRAGGRLGALTLDGPRQSWPLDVALARAFVAPRFALIGDAAHSVHPIAGQGLNLGLRDVAALAEVVVDAQRLGLDIGSSATLRGYEQWRRFDTWMSATSFDGLNRLFSNGGVMRRAVREFGLGLVNRLPGLKERLVAEAAGTTGQLPRLLRGEAI